MRNAIRVAYTPDDRCISLKWMSQQSHSPWMTLIRPNTMSHSCRYRNKNCAGVRLGILWRRRVRGRLAHHQLIPVASLYLGAGTMVQHHILGGAPESGHHQKDRGHHQKDRFNIRYVPSCIYHPSIIIHYHIYPEGHNMLWWAISQYHHPRLHMGTILKVVSPRRSWRTVQALNIKNIGQAHMVSKID